MRKFIATVLILAIFGGSLAACGHRRTIDGVTYDTYGLLNQDDKKNPDIQYEIIWGNIIWGALLVETIIAPIYFFGFSCFQPIGKKPKIKGQVT